MRFAMIWAAGALLASGLLGAQQPAGDAAPRLTAELVERAARNKPPMLTDLAASLARQPDMTGTWEMVPPPGSASRSGLGGTDEPIRGASQPPYNPEYAKIYRQHLAELEEGNNRDTFATCVPYGVPRGVVNNAAWFDIIQAPEVMLWYGDYGRTHRRIFLDGRSHPQEGDPEVFDSSRTFSGHSTGRWEGTTLVVDTVDMIPLFFNEQGAPHSEQLHMTERLRVIDAHYLENEVTFTDPGAFVRPWVVKVYYRRVQSMVWTDETRKPAWKRFHNYLNLNDHVCIPNVRLNESGFQVTMLPQEIEAEAAKAQRNLIAPQQ